MNKPNIDSNIDLKKFNRRSDLDALRVMATILLIYFHTAMIFNLWASFHIQNDELSLGMALFVEFFNIWHMPLFVILAGMSSFYALEIRSGKQFTKDRAKRLLIPLLFGILLVIPPQVYIERIAWWCKTRQSPINFTGSYFDFYPYFFIPIYPEGNLSWHHLWFLFYLFFISIVSLPLLLQLNMEKGKQRISKLADFFQKSRYIFLLFIPIALINISLSWLFSGSQNFVYDWDRILHFIFLFVLGFIIVSDARFEVSIDRNKKIALVIGVIIASFILVVDAIVYINSISIELIAFYFIGCILWALCEWCWLIAFIGYARKYLKKPNKIINHLSEIALPFYIFHQTIIIVLAYFIIPWNASILIKYLTISSISLLLTIVLCELIKTNKVTRFMFGMKLKRKAYIKG